MAENDPKDPNGPVEPPPLIHTVTAPADPDADAEVEAAAAQADREWRLIDAEEQSKRLQPMYVNRAYVKMEGHVLRISFGERVNDEDVYRSTIVMTPQDAYELGELLVAQGAGAFAQLVDHYRHIISALPKQEEPNG